MKISSRGRYGLKLMVELAAQYEQGPLQAEAIARNQGISGKYIHVLATALRTAGLLRAARGRTGGYELAKPPGAITALEVITALEGEIVPVDCVARVNACNDADSCSARQVWCAVASAVSSSLNSFTLSALAAQEQAARMRNNPVYEI